MDLKIDLKNIKFEDIKEKIKNTEKKTFIKIGIAVGSVILFLIIYYAILNPIVERKKAKLLERGTQGGQDFFDAGGEPPVTCWCTCGQPASNLA